MINDMIAESASYELTLLRMPRYDQQALFLRYCFIDSNAPLMHIGGAIFVMSCIHVSEAP